MIRIQSRISLGWLFFGIWLRRFLIGLPFGLPFGFPFGLPFGLSFGFGLPPKNWTDF